jgi:hypothetical protein
VPTVTLITPSARAFFGDSTALDIIEHWACTAPPSSTQKMSTMQTIDTYREAIKNRPEEVARCLIAIAQAAQAIAFCQQTVEHKLASLAQAAMFAMNERSPLVLAMVARSVLEHASTLAYLSNIACRCTEKISGSGDVVRASKALSELVEVCREMHFGSGQLATGKRPIHVHDAIKAMNQHLPDVMRGYDFLSDFVHPNHGSNMLVAVGGPGEGVVGVEAADHPSVIHARRAMVRLLAATIMASRNVTLHLAHSVCQLDNWFIRGLDEKCKSTRIFAPARTAIIGDGRSRESAYRFPKAATAAEHIQLQIAWVRLNLPTDAVRTSEPNDVWIFDVYQHGNPPQQVWFKVPSANGEASIFALNED